MKVEKKEKIILLAISVAISCIAYNEFLRGYNSIDMAKIIAIGYDQYSIQFSLYDGRIIMAMIGLLANSIKIQLNIYYIILLSASIIISSISVIKIYSIINNIKPAQKKLTKIIIFMAAYCYIFNFTNINNFQFIECIVMSISTLLYILASEELIIKDKKINCFALCMLATICYQGTIGMFFATTLLLIFIQKDRNFKKIVDLIVISVMVIGIDFLIITIAQNNIYTTQNQSGRLNMDFMQNLKSMINRLPYLIYSSLGLYPKFLQMIFIILFLTLIYIYGIKKKEPSKFMYSILIMIIFFASSLAMGIVYQGLIEPQNGRVVNSIGASISALILYCYADTKIFEYKFYKEVGICLTIFYFITVNINTLQITNNLKSENLIDEEFAKQIVQEIKKYEDQNPNIKVTNMAINYIIDLNNKEEGKFSPSYKKVALFGETQMILYANYEIEKVEFTDEIKNKYFNNEEEKMICIGDTIYIQTII